MPRTPSRKKKPAPKRTRRPADATTRRPGRLKVVLAGLTVGAVLAIGLALYLDVQVRSRFEGRIWMIPSRVYSDLLVLSVGDRVPAAVVTARLERCGYARTTGPPLQPGQFRQRGGRLELFVREFATPTASERSNRATLTYQGDRIASIVDGLGRPVRHARLEPELLAELFGSRQEQREPVALDEVPERFRQAVLAAEDARFYSHHGLDLRGILRAGAANVRSMGVVQGGSTITQQTAKNLFLGQERTWWRKGRELLLSLVLDARYDKDRILETYLNEVYLGQRGPVAICGAQAAARFYFGRDLDQLTLGEWALLAGMIKSPGRYNPFAHPDRALARRDQVLAAMVRLGWVEAADAQRASSGALQLGTGGAGYRGAAYAVDFVTGQLGRRFPARVLQSDGLHIYTTIDTRLQQLAESALERGLERLGNEAPEVRRQRAERQLQGAIVVTRPAAGEILALVGGRDYRATQFNRAVQARRQPGSCFKPFVFAAGFEQSLGGRGGGLTPATMLEDEPLVLVVDGQTWQPANYDRQHRGAVTVRQALEQSLNVPTVRAGQQVGLASVIDLARRSGIESALAPVPSLPLGTEEVSPLELATAYGTLSQHGRRATPWVIRSVTDRHGHVLDGRQVERRQAVDPRAAYLATTLMQGVFTRGTARSAAGLGYDGLAAGKTGTTDDTRDAWFVGFTPELLALVWVGYDDNARTGLTGATGALPIWSDLMRQAGGPRGAAFRVPEGIVERRVDPASGRLAVGACPESIPEKFVAGTEPRKECNLHMGKLKRWWRNLVKKRG